MTNTYLFYSTVVGLGTSASPFKTSLSSYSHKYRLNDGRLDITNPDPDIYAMLIEVELDDDNLFLAQNDPRMVQLIPSPVPLLVAPIHTFLTIEQLHNLGLAMELRSFDAKPLNDALNYFDFYRYLLWEFKFRTLFKEDYFIVDIGEDIDQIDLMVMLSKLTTAGFDTDFIQQDMTPRDLIRQMISQRNDTETLQRFFQTHLDLPQHKRLSNG